MSGRTSIEWMRRTHRMMPLTPQERSISDLLIEMRLPFESHHVFEFSPKVRMSVDFLIFSGSGIVLECTYCSRRRSSALWELKRRCTFINYRFGQVKRALPSIVCGALVEAPKEDEEQIRLEAAPILDKADFVACSIERLEASIKECR